MAGGPVILESVSPPCITARTKIVLSDIVVALIAHSRVVVANVELAVKAAVVLPLGDTLDAEGQVAGAIADAHGSDVKDMDVQAIEMLGQLIGGVRQGCNDSPREALHAVNGERRGWAWHCLGTVISAAAF